MALSGDVVVKALEPLSRPWSLAIVYSLDRSRPTRFNELKKSIPGICPASLSERLEELIALGVVTKTVVIGPPPHTEYYLTEKGEGLRKIVEQIVAWWASWEGLTSRTGAGNFSD